MTYQQLWCYIECPTKISEKEAAEKFDSYWEDYDNELPWDPAPDVLRVREHWEKVLEVVKTVMKEEGA